MRQAEWRGVVETGRERCVAVVMESQHSTPSLALPRCRRQRGRGSESGEYRRHRRSLTVAGSRPPHVFITGGSLVECHPPRPTQSCRQLDSCRGLPARKGGGTNGLMGLVHVDLEVSREGGPRQTVEFLVDSGAVYSVLPWRVWQRLKLKPMRTLKFTLADGTTVRRRVSECRFRYNGLEASSPVVLGERKDEALLGTVTLETLGLVLNPFERTLRPMRMMLA